MNIPDRQHAGSHEGQMCRICRHDGPHQRYEAREMMYGSRENFKYFKCTACGCLQINSVPDDLSIYYPKGYYSLGQSHSPPCRPWPRALLEKMRAGSALFERGYKASKLAAQFVDIPSEVHAVGAHLKKCGIRSWDASFLDVGCGSRSWWLDSLNAVGFRHLIGVDPHIENSAEYGDVRIEKSDIQGIAGKFDLVSLHHSLEHIPDQRKTLSSVKARMKPDGRCLLRIPLVSSLPWEMFGVDWVELDAPRHLYLHSLDSISLVCREAGLDIVDISWDSTEFDFAASEQYRRGIPLLAETSFWKNPSRSEFTYREMADFSDMAVKANREGKGGRACFILRIADAPE